jgi:hypothetical protein
MDSFRRTSLVGLAAIGAAALSAMGGTGVQAAKVGFGSLFLNGGVVGTVVVPAHVAPGSGEDPFYEVTNGASGQLGIAGVGPGEPGYHGGDWEVFTVTFNTGISPYVLKSAAAVQAAAQSEDVTIVRQPGQDFRCPITMP